MQLIFATTEDPGRNKDLTHYGLNHRLISYWYFMKANENQIKHFVDTGSIFRKLRKRKV